VKDSYIDLIAAAVVTLAQLYVIEPWKFPVFAKFWDWLATLCGVLANHLGWMAMRARSNYYLAVSEYGN
jgi:hypothetical protein